ncbi:unnamed protein product [Ranitomeya imitator]|uniref:Telomerase reverse transcriptase n=1 Tax=Ranitomeya imitator TaxID=111125 RepID=A0ABN9KUN1_9NEOB|nr:unnamed protein product [Ranitomeya imitator]
MQLWLRIADYRERSRYQGYRCGYLGSAIAIRISSYYTYCTFGIAFWKWAYPFNLFLTKELMYTLCLMQTDIKEAYDTIPHSKLAEVIAQVINTDNEEVYCIRRYAIVWMDSQGRIRKTFKRHVSNLVDFLPNMKCFLTHFQEDNLVQNAIFVEQKSFCYNDKNHLLHKLQICIVLFNDGELKSRQDITIHSIWGKWLYGASYGAITFFKVAPFCFDDCFAHSWHSLDELQEVVTGNGFHFTGQSVKKIGKTLKVSPSAVAKTIKLYNKTGSHEDRPRKGRPRVTSASEDKFIRVTCLRNRRLTAAQIRDQVNATQSSSSRHISTTTVKRRLCAAGLRGKIAARKPLLRTGNKQKRLAWAKEHKE